jgi:LasA protease
MPMRKNVSYPQLLIILFLIPLTFACIIPTTTTAVPTLNLPTGSPATQNGNLQPTQTPSFEPTNLSVDQTSAPLPTQSPVSHPNFEEYEVQENDTLTIIARHFGVEIAQLLLVNDIPNPDLLVLGQKLLIPPAAPQEPGSNFIIIPDSELVFSPSAADFDINAFVQSKQGYLNSYEDIISEQSVKGPEVVSRVAREYSVNPRILLAFIEYQTNWVSQKNKPNKEKINYPFFHWEDWRKGLYLQLSWVANQMNYGYYAWKAHGIKLWVFTDGYALRISPDLNPGTVGIQNLMSRLNTKSDWEKTISSEGIYTSYLSLFGDPNAHRIDPLVPSNLIQPKLQLPIEDGTTWSFTGGPHGGWGSGSAWAALDFAPPGESLGCVITDAWAVAVADGLIVRSENGSVIQDLDGDGLEQTGWTILYLHVDSQERVAVGTYLKAGEHIGHPSCEGGVSIATHLHLARRYNGEWIPADGSLPFNLDGWISEGTGIEYNGYLKRNDQVVEAWDSFRSENQIQR